MADLVVPTLGESISEAVLSRWMKNVGDHVEADEPVLELESDKITMQLPSPVAGTLGEQRATSGATVKVGDVVGVIQAGAAATAKPEGGSGGKAEAPQPAPAQAATAPAKKEKGGASGTATNSNTAETAVVGEAAQPAPGAAASPPSTTPSPAGKNGERQRLSPSMRRAQRERSEAAPSAPATEQAPASGERSARAPSPPPVARRSGSAASDDDEVVPMSAMRKRIAERLVEAQHAAAALTTFNEVDLSAVMALREAFKQDFVDRHGVKLGFMSFFAKACVEALRLYPGLNAELRGDAIVYKKRYDLGIAVSTERGLIVPVLRGVDALDFAEIEQGIGALAGKARSGKLTIEDLTGGTFTITNGGIYGSMMSTPLLNHPQTGILGMHNIVERAVVIDGKIEVRPMMYLALTYDHRVVDGKEAVSFLVAVKQRIERPDRLLLGV